MGVRPGSEHDEAEQRLKSAAARCRELGPSFRLALTLLEHREWLVVPGEQRKANRCSPLCERPWSASRRSPGPSMRRSPSRCGGPRL